MSLFYRLWVLLASTFGALLLLLGIGEYQTLRRALSQEVDHNLERRAHWIETELDHGRLPTGMMLPDGHPLEEIGKLFVEIYFKGELIAHSANLSGQRLPGQPQEGTGFQTVATPAQHPFRIFQLRTARNEVIRVGESLELVYKSLGGSLLKLFLGGSFALVLAAWMSYRILWQICHPLSQLASAGAEIATKGDVSRRLKIGPEVVAEVRVVSDTINQLLARVEELLAAQSRLLQDTSHELRNPLGVLQMDLDLLVKHDLPEQTRDEVGLEMKGELARLIRLVGDLLQISWAETETKVELRRLDSGAFLSNLLAGYDSRRGQRNLLLCGSNHFILADESRLEQVVRNLLDNAFRYSGLEATITVWMSAEIAADLEASLPPGSRKSTGDDRFIIVQDDGPGIPLEHQRRIFERFYRLESDRNRLRGGTGLGLPVAQALARAMGGELWVHSSSGRGASFCLRLRSAPEGSE